MASKKIFVNVAVKDLNKSIAFYTALGYTFNPHFTDETATCMIISEDIFVMLLTEEKFLTFSPHPIANAKESTEVLICLSMESRQEVDEIVAKAVAAGGNAFKPATDYGFMYSHCFQDLDGHVWEHVWMDPSAIPPS